MKLSWNVFDFDPSYYPDLAGRTVRTMDYTHTNGSPVVHWDDAQAAIYTTLFNLANAGGFDLWCNVPHAATDAWIDAFSALARATLAVGRKVKLELSNETWNTMFTHPKYYYVHGVAELSPRRASITYSGGLCHVTRETDHGLVTGQLAQVDGATDPAYNGAYAATVTGPRTYDYTPATAPASSPAGAPERLHVLAYKVDQPAVTAIDSLTVAVDGTSAMLTVRCPAPAGIGRIDVVSLSNFADDWLNRLWFVAECDPASDTVVIFCADQGEPVQTPAFPDGVTSYVAAPRAGMTPTIARMAGYIDIPSGGSGELLNIEFQQVVFGRYAARMHRRAMAAWAGREADFGRVLAIQIGNTNAIAAYAAEFGATPAGFSPLELAFAPYLGQAQTIGNPPIFLASLVSNGDGTATATATAPHGLSAGDWVGTSNVDDAAYVGRVQVLSAGSTTFRIPVPGEATSGTPARLYQYCPITVLKDPLGLEITAASRADDVVTLTVPGHTHQVGDAILVGGFVTVGHDGAYTVSAISGDTLSYAAPSAVAGNPVIGGQRPWVLPQSTVDMAVQVIADAADGEYPARLAFHSATADAYGARKCFYEWNVHLIVPPGINVPLYHIAYGAASRSEAMYDIFLRCFRLAYEAGFYELCLYCYRGLHGVWGYWGFLEYGQPSSGAGTSWRMRAVQVATGLYQSVVASVRRFLFRRPK